MENHNRKPKFKKTPTGQIQVTHRDVDILLSLYEHRLLRSTHLYSLHDSFVSLPTLQRRLQKLFHHGFIDRILEPAIYQPGDKPFIYSVSTVGARLLAQNGLIPKKKTDISALNKVLSSDFIEHALLTSDVIVAFKVACKVHGVRFIEPAEIIESAPESTRKQANPFKWREMIVLDGKRKLLGITPDKMFGLHFPEREEGRDKLYFLLEADRARMPVRRKGLNQSSIFKKMMIYSQTYKNKTHTKKFNIKNFRVIFYTSSAIRLDNMIAANKELNNGSGSRVFLFADRDTFSANDPLKMPWWNGRDQSPQSLYN